MIGLRKVPHNPEFMKLLHIFFFILFFGYSFAQYDDIRDDCLFLEGRLLFEKTLYPAAIEKLVTARQLTSDPDELRELDYLLAVAAFQLQERDVLYILEDYSKKYPDARHIDELDYLAGCLRFDNAALDYALGRYPQALVTLSALKQRPLFTHHAAELLMYIYFIQGDYAQALQEAQCLDPQFDDLETHRIIGECYYRLNDKHNARPHLQIYVDETDEPRRSSDYLLAVCLFDEAELHKAVIRFRAVADNQTDTLAQSARLYIVQAFLDAGDLSNARMALEDFLRDFPNSSYFPFVEQRLSNLLFSFGKEAFLGGATDVALVHFSRVIDIAKKYKSNILPSAYFWRAETYYRLGDYSHAEKDYRHAPFPAATYGLAYCSFKQKNYDAALPLFKQYIALTPNDTEAYADALNRAADCLFHYRRFKQAADTYQQAAELFPQNADYPLFQKAFIAGLEKDYNAKAAGMDSLLRQFPQSSRVSTALYEKGRAFVMLNKFQDAASAFEILIRTHPHSPLAPKAAVQLGLIYFNEGHLEKAIEHYKRVLSDYPGSEEARIALHDLKAVYIEMNDVKAYTSYVASLGGNVRPDPNEEDSLTYLAAERLLMRENDKASALTALRHYLDKFPTGAFKIQAQLNVLRAVHLLSKNEEAVKAADDLLGNPDLSPDLSLEVHYVRVKALIGMGRQTDALTDLEILSQDTHTPQGAEAKYLLAQYYYDEADDERTLALLEDFADKGTPHAYWLARAFILWADVYIRQGDPVQARIYLQNLQTNYKGENDGIASMILDRLNRLDL
ncbi:MAG: tetratricopeptide repeat protein [Tannerellaceae bacterium]|jgi:tetratricopeptide (TPR) repeat protein|nr:tetratricopeptide repeat protein [Tannerellaceae bacterium]